MEDEAAIQAVLDKAKRGFAIAPVGNRPLWQRLLELAYAAGFMLRTKADGWKLFCERLHVPPFLVWQELPGFERLQEALAQTEKTAFNAEGMLRWLNTCASDWRAGDDRASLDRRWRSRRYGARIQAARGVVGRLGHGRLVYLPRAGVRQLGSRQISMRKSDHDLQ